MSQKHDYYFFVKNGIPKAHTLLLLCKKWHSQSITKYRDCRKSKGDKTRNTTITSKWHSQSTYTITSLYMYLCYSLETSDVEVRQYSLAYDAPRDRTFLGGAKLRLLEWVLNRAAKVCKKRAEASKQKGENIGIVDKAQKIRFGMSPMYS